MKMQNQAELTAGADRGHKKHMSGKAYEQVPVLICGSYACRSFARCCHFGRGGRRERKRVRVGIIMWMFCGVVVRARGSPRVGGGVCGWGGGGGIPPNEENPPPKYLGEKTEFAQ